MTLPLHDEPPLVTIEESWEYVGEGRDPPDVSVGDFVPRPKSCETRALPTTASNRARRFGPRSRWSRTRGTPGRAVDYHEGPSWTIDAVYRETAAEVERYRERGVMTVETELATTLAVAAHHGVEAGGLFVVSDRLGDEWEQGFKDPFDRLEEAFDYGVGILSTG